MIGPLPNAPGGFNRVLVAIDKFTKWIEVKPVTFPKADRVLDFLDELVHRYGLPHPRMATVRVRCGYPRVSVPRVSVLVLFFRPRFCGFGYPKIHGFGAVFDFHPWCSVGAPKNAAH
jgi:hypothetical protein